MIDNRLPPVEASSLITVERDGRMIDVISIEIRLGDIYRFEGKRYQVIDITCAKENSLEIKSICLEPTNAEVGFNATNNV